MGRSFSESAWCPYKHLNNAYTHSFETLQKFYRESPAGGVTEGTRQEANHAMRETAAVEGHMGELISKADEAGLEDEEKDKIRDIADEARRIRQEMAKTGVPLPNQEPSPESTETFESLLRDIEELRDQDLGEFASVMSQEQMECLRCEEDVERIKERVGGELKRELISERGQAKGSDSRGGLETPQKQEQEGDFLSQALGDTQMVNTTDIQMLTVGAFGSKTLEELTEFAADEVGDGLSVGPVGPSSLLNLGVGIGVPLSELLSGSMTDLLGDDLALAAVAGSLNLLANEVGDLSQELTGDNASGQALSTRQATVSSTASASTRGEGDSETPTDTTGGLNVGQGEAAEAREQPKGLNVGQGYTDSEPRSEGLSV